MMWLRNTMWNQYTDSTGGETCTQDKDKTKYHSKMIQKCNNFTLSYVL